MGILGSIINSFNSWNRSLRLEAAALYFSTRPGLRPIPLFIFLWSWLYNALLSPMGMSLCDKDLILFSASWLRGVTLAIANFGMEGIYSVGFKVQDKSYLNVFKLDDSGKRCQPQPAGVITPGFHDHCRSIQGTVMVLPSRDDVATGAACHLEKWWESRLGRL